MSDEQKRKLRLEIAHVLFIDIVGYSKLLISEQSDLLERLKAIVRGSEEVRAAEAEGKLIRLATGDGMALVFRNSPEAPVQCALELARAVKQHPELPLRMGIHSGPINEVSDVNDRANVTGAGINMAQRIMDCGDAGHILLSQHVADDLEQYGQWRPLLHDLGECEVKHGVRLHAVNLYNGEAGNQAVPDKFRTAKASAEEIAIPSAGSSAVRWSPIVVGATLLALGAVAFLWWHRSSTGSASADKPGPPAAAPAVPAIPEKSVAVLPFESLSKDEENAFFTNGVQDQILTVLAKVADLRVISRTSVMQYKSGALRNLRQIAQELGVAHVLEGSVQRINNRVRVTAQLIDARTDRHLWAEHYDRELADVFAIQSEIAKTIADQLQAKISPREKAAIAAAPTTDLEANALYVQAIQLETKAPEEPNIREAIRLLDQAVARDPQFLLAYCALGRMHLTLFHGGYDHSPARRELANVAIQNAVRLQPDAGEVHLALARYAYHGFRDYDRARAELGLARSRLSNEVDVFHLTAILDRRQGRFKEATSNFERAIALDPRNAPLLMNAATTYMYSREYADATRLFQRVVTISPNDYQARCSLAYQPFLERADVGPMKAEVVAILTEKTGITDLADFLVNSALVTRDREAANRALAAMPERGTLGRANIIYPREWFVGVVARTFNDAAAARTSFTAARVIVGRVVQDQPDYAPALSLLGLIDAALGRKEEAVFEGRRACELMPLSKDAAVGSVSILNLATIYTWTGENDLAVEQLAISARIAGGVTYGELKLHPYWDPLRGDPRFEQIVADLAPKPTNR
ncbi:MAG: tetratricopeptide repeat protein [Chthoniobacterales bacterium]